jgi:hypothetical protein
VAHFHLEVFLTNRNSAVALAKKKHKKKPSFLHSVSFEQIMYYNIIADTIFIVGTETVLRAGRLCFRTPAGSRDFSLL